MTVQNRADRIARVAAQLRASGYRRAGIYDVTPSEVRLIAFDGPSPDAHPTFPSTAGITSNAIRSGEPVVSNEVLIVPILDPRGRTVGIIDVETERTGGFGESAVAALQTIATEVLPLFTGVEVRSACESDAAEIAAIYSYYVTDTVVSFEERPPSGAEMRQRMIEHLKLMPWLVATLADTIVGYAYAQPHRTRAAYRWAADVSVYVDRFMHGRGFGKRLYEALFEILERQGFRRLLAGITCPNVASEALHKAFGFTPVGTYKRIGWKRGAWHDTLWLQRDVGPDNDPPAEPLPFANLA